MRCNQETDFKRLFIHYDKVVRKETQSDNTVQVFGSEADVERISGRKRRTLQKDRRFGRGFPFYRFHGQILYDLEEVRDLIRAGRVELGEGGHRT